MTLCHLPGLQLSFPLSTCGFGYFPPAPLPDLLGYIFFFFSELNVSFG